MVLRFFFIPVFLCFSLLLGAREEAPQQVPSEESIGEGSEEANIELLIQAQELSAKKLKDLLHALKQYRAQEGKCIQDPDNLDKLYTLSEYALILKKTIKECYVEAYFRQNFLDDLENVSRAAEKRTPPTLSKS
jgi:5'-deoxynucleotidase YfbR-like HD superfamily hydrolase